MTRDFHIESAAGQDLGCWEADTIVDALADALRAHYAADVVVEDGRLTVADPTDIPQQYQITEDTGDAFFFTRFTL